MAILTTFKHTGNPDEMLKLAEDKVRPAARQAGGEEGQISSTIVRTEDGIMLINLWETEEGMRRAVGRFPHGTAVTRQRLVTSSFSQSAVSATASCELT
jgi:hypothetical protein